MIILLVRLEPIPEIEFTSADRYLGRRMSQGRYNYHDDDIDYRSRSESLPGVEH